MGAVSTRIASKAWVQFAESFTHLNFIQQADDILRQKMELILHEHEQEVAELRDANETNLRELTEKYEAEIKKQQEELTTEIGKDIGGPLEILSFLIS